MIISEHGTRVIFRRGGNHIFMSDLVHMSRIYKIEDRLRKIEEAIQNIQKWQERIDAILPPMESGFDKDPSLLINVFEGDKDGSAELCDDTVEKYLSGKSRSVEEKEAEQEAPEKENNPKGAIDAQ